MMTGWFTRSRQTRTQVQSRAEDRMERHRSAEAAYRVLGAIQLTAQLVLWITFFAYDQTVQTTWQAALMLLVPLGGLWALWRGGEGALYTRAGAMWALLLLPCLMLDAALLLRTLSGYISQLIPEYPFWACVLIPAALCWLTVLLARENGAAYGAQLFCTLLVLLFLLATVFLNATVHTVRLWPLLGQGLGRTARAALSGAGGTWGVALLFALPVHSLCGQRRPDGRSAPGWRCALCAALPWALGVLWALWYGLVRPWQSGDLLAVGERLMGMARHSSSPLLYECTGLLWMLLLPLSLIGCAVSGEKLLRAAIPKLPRSLAALSPLFPAIAGALFWRDGVMPALEWALPWRAALCAVAGAALCVITLRGRKGERA